MIEVAEVGHLEGAELDEVIERAAQTALYFKTWLAYAYRLSTGRTVDHKDLQVDAPDISPEDNIQLAQAVSSLSSSFSLMNIVIGRSPTWQARAVRWFVKFLGERIGEEEIRQIIEEGQANAAKVAQAVEENAEEHAEDVEQRGANTPRAVK